MIEGSLKLVPTSHYGATCSCPQLELNGLCVLTETPACLVHTMENDLALLPVAQAQRPVAWTCDSYARVTQHLCSKAAAQFLYFLKWFLNLNWLSCLPVRHRLTLLSGQEPTASKVNSVLACLLLETLALYSFGSQFI